MKRNDAPGACSQALHIALRAVGPTFDSVAVDLARHTTAGGSDLHAISPRGNVPLQELDHGSRHPHLKTYPTRVSERLRTLKALRAEEIAQ